MPGHVATALSIVNRTITFDYQLRFTAIRVSDVSSNLVLTSKFEPKHLAIAKQLPQKRLGSCLVFSKLAHELKQSGEVIAAAVMPLLAHDKGKKEKEVLLLTSTNFVPHLSPLPKGEGTGNCNLKLNESIRQGRNRAR